jgi:hypothetical protein
MKLKHAAVIEPNQARWKTLSQSLTKAGLSVTQAREAAALTKEQVVLLGPSAKSPSRMANQVRAKVPQALVLAAQSKGFKAPFADAVVPLPVSANDLKVRLLEWQSRRPAEPSCRDRAREFWTRPPSSTPSVTSKRCSSSR